MTTDMSSDIASAVNQAGQNTIQKPGRPRRTYSFVRRDALLLIGVIILLVIVAMAVAIPVTSPFDPFAQDLFGRLKPPRWIN